MNIGDFLMKSEYFGKSTAEAAVAYIGNDPERFDQLMDGFFNGTSRLVQRSAWVLSKSADKYPHLLEPHYEKMILNLAHDTPVSVLRNSLRILQNKTIEGDLLGPLVNISFELLASAEQPIAVKVFAMTVLSQACKQEPDLANELRPLIEEQMPYGSAGFKSRGKKILRQLDKLKQS